MEWRDVVGFESYQVSSCGQVRSKKRMRPLVPCIDKDGYARIVMSGPGGVRKTASIHRLAAVAFHGWPECESMQVRHLDGDPSNNSAENLAWGTAKENAEDRDRHGRQARGEFSCRSKATDAQILQAMRRGQEIGPGAAAKEIGVSPALLWMVKQQRARKHLSEELRKLGVI